MRPGNAESNLPDGVLEGLQHQGVMPVLVRTPLASNKSPLSLANSKSHEGKGPRTAELNIKAVGSCCLRQPQGAGSACL